MGGKVLLTGGSGFVAAHVLEVLLEEGFEVTVTVRSEEKGQKILQDHANLQKGKVSFAIVGDIAEEGAFDEVVKSDPPFEFVIHTASPYHFNYKDPVKDFLDPAIKGTTGLLNAVKTHAPTVKRVVLTSSFAAIVNPDNHAKVYDETVFGAITWEQAMDPPKTYRASKIFAEKAAWDFVAQQKSAFDLVTINPPMVFGPTAYPFANLDALNESNVRIRDMIQGKYKDGLPPNNIYLWVDVRDVALAHVRAMTTPEASGRRFLVTAGHFSNKKIAETIRDLHPELNAQLPSKEFPDEIPDDVYGYDNTRSREVLGIKYRSLKTCIDDAVQSMLAVGIWS